MEQFRGDTAWLGILQQRLHSELPSELRLLLACLQHGLHRTDSKQCEFLTHQEINWDQFLSLVKWHRVEPVVLPILQQRKNIPSKTTMALQQQVARNAQRGLERAAESVRIVKIFAAHEIPAILLKGVALALQLYGDLARRYHGDIDILIAPHHLERAEQLLRRRGYQRKYPSPELVLTPAQRKSMIELRHNLIYNHPQQRIHLELHWKLHYIHSLCPLNFGQLYQERQTVQIAGHPVPTLSNDQTLLFLCVHGASHLWYRVYWLYDLAELLRHGQTFDWERLMMDARNLGMARSLAQGCLLAHLLLHSVLPEPVRSYIFQDRIIPVLINQVIHSLLQQRRYNWAIATFIRHKRYLMRLRPGQRHKLEILRAALIAPNDWQRYKLPDPLFPLYYLLRPVFWLTRKRRN